MGRQEMVAAFLSLLWLPCLAAAQEVKPWSERFPDIARRIRHLDRRLGEGNVEIRKRVVAELTTYRPRDSKLYPKFFRALLDDPSPAIRHSALQRLYEHNVWPAAKDLPESFDVPFVGEVAWRQPDGLGRLRDQARSLGAPGGWAMQTLGIIGDKEAIPLARRQLTSDNVFVRFSAAVALVQLGEKKEGMDALHLLTDAGDDASGFYRYRAAECLYRLGDKSGMNALIGLLAQKAHEGYASGPRDILEDLTGEYFLTAAEARVWWNEHAPMSP